MAEQMTDRRSFVTALKSVSPALSKKDFIPAFACFCFDDSIVLTYDDVVAMQSPLDSGLVGAVRGDVLLKWFGAFEASGKSGKSPVRFDHDDHEVTFRAGRSRITLPVLGRDEFLFDMPPLSEGEPLPAELAAAIELCVVSMSSDLSRGWRCGITVSFEKSGVSLWSTDDFAMTRTFVKGAHKTLTGDAVVLAPRFCHLMRDISKSDKPKRIYLSDDWTQVEFESGLRLFARTVEQVNVGEYCKVYDATKEHVEKAGTFPVPVGFERAMDRALAVLMPYKTKRSAMHVRPSTSRKRKGPCELVIESTSPIGEARDRLAVLEEVEEIKVESYPEQLRKLVAGAHSLAVTERSILVEGASAEHIVGVVSG